MPTVVVVIQQAAVNFMPTVIKCLFVSSESLGLNKKSALSSVYNKRSAILANNGEISGDGEENVYILKWTKILGGK